MIWVLFVAIAEACVDNTGVVVAGGGPDGTDITCALVASSSPAPGCTNLPDELQSVIQSACPLTCGLCAPSTTPCADSTGVVVADDDPDGTDITCALVASSSPAPGCTNLPDELQSVIQSACPLTCGLCTPSTTPCADSTGVVVADDDPDGTDITCALVASSSPAPGCTNLPDELQSVIQSACPLTCGLCTPSTTPCADSTGVVVADDDPDGTDITCALVASSSPAPGCTNLPDELQSVIQSACPLTCGLCTPSTSPCADSTGVVVADDDPDGTDITCALVASSSPAPGCTNLPDELRSVIQSACPLTCGLCPATPPALASAPTAPPVTLPPATPPVPPSPPANPGCVPDGTTGVPQSLLQTFPLSAGRPPLDCFELSLADPTSAEFVCYQRGLFIEAYIQQIQQSGNINLDYSYDGPERIYQLCPQSCAPFGFGPCAAPTPPPPRAPPSPPPIPPLQPQPPAPPAPPISPPSLPLLPNLPPYEPPSAVSPSPPPLPPNPPPVPASPGVEVVAGLNELRSRLDELYQALSTSSGRRARSLSLFQDPPARFGFHSGHYRLNGQPIALRGVNVIVECITVKGECILDAESQSRIFNVQEGAQLEVRQMVLVNGLSTESDAPTGEVPYCRSSPTASSVKVTGVLGAVPSWVSSQCGASKPAGTYASAAGCGGAIFVDSCSKLNVTQGSIISDSAANEGGAIFAQFEANVHVADSLITRCNSLKNAGAISSRLSAGKGRVQVERSEISHCTATLSGGAIALEVDAASWTPLERLTLLGVMLRNNTCQAQRANSLDLLGGGGLYVLFGTDLSVAGTQPTELLLGTVSNTTFVDCQAGEYGSASWLAAGRGGAVYMATSLDETPLLTTMTLYYLLQFRHTRFLRSRSMLGGGGLYVSASSAELSNCIFQSCEADLFGAGDPSYTASQSSGGGALAVSYASASLQGCSSNACRARLGGFISVNQGAVSWLAHECEDFECPSDTIFSANVSISECVAWGINPVEESIDGKGGCFFSRESRLQLSGGQISHAHAVTNGGAIYSSGISAILLVDGVRMNNNSAGSDGGSIAIYDSQTKLSNLVIDNTRTCATFAPNSVGASRCGAIYARADFGGAALVIQQVSMHGNSAPQGAAQAMMLDCTFDLTLVDVSAPCDSAAAASPQVALEPIGSAENGEIHSVRGMRIQTCDGGAAAQPVISWDTAPVCSARTFNNVLFGGDVVQQNGICGPGATCSDVTEPSGVPDGTRYGVLCTCELPAYTRDVTAGLLGPFDHSLGCESLRRPESLQVVEREISVILHKRASGDPVVAIRNVTLQMNGSAQAVSYWRAHRVFISPEHPGEEWIQFIEHEGSMVACLAGTTSPCIAPLAEIPVLFNSSGQREQSTALQGNIIFEVSVVDDDDRISGTPIVGTAAQLANPSNISIRAELSISADEVAAHTRWGESCSSNVLGDAPIEWSPLPLHEIRTQVFSACDRDRLPVQHSLPALPPYPPDTNFSYKIIRVRNATHEEDTSPRRSPQYLGAGRYTVELQVHTLGTWMIQLFLGEQLAATAYWNGSCPQVQVALDDEHCGCPEGYRDRGGAAGRELCQLCPADTFKATNGSDECTLCAEVIPGSTTLNILGSPSISACKCRAGFFLKPGNSSTCVQCPQGTNCSDGTSLDALQLLPGYWRIAPASQDIRLCPSSSHGACLGGSNLSAICATGHRGPLCSACEKDYYQSSEGCTLCFDKGGGAIPATLAVAIVLFALTIAFCLIAYCLLRGGSLVRRSVMPTRLLTLLWSKRSILLVKIKIFIGCYQILSGMGSTFDVAYPIAYEALLEAFAFVKLDFVEVLPMSCFMQYGFYQSLVVKAGFPLGVYLVLVALGSAAKASHHPNSSRFFTSAGIVLIFLTFPSASQTAFAYFNCESFDNARYLKADYDIDCNSSEHETWLPVALVFLAVWASVPIFYCAIFAFHREVLIELYTHEARKRAAKKALMIESSRVSTRLNELLAAEREALEVSAGFVSDGGSMSVDLFLLTDSYQHSFFWWESLEATRKLLILGFLMFYEQGSFYQIMVGLLVCLASSMAYAYFNPFKTKTDNAMAILCEVSNFVGLVSALPIREIGVSENDESALESFLVTLAILPAAMIIPLSLAQLFLELGVEEKVLYQPFKHPRRLFARLQLVYKKAPPVDAIKVDVGS